MTDSKPRKVAPKVTGETDPRPDEVDSGGIGGAEALPQGESGEADFTPPRQGQPRTFRELLDLSKLKFGQRLIGWCLFLIVSLSLIGYFGGDGERGGELSAAIELLKLVTTTALGFIFAKDQMASASPGRGSVD